MVISDCAVLLARGVPTVLPPVNAATIRTDGRGRAHDDRTPLGTWRAPEARQVALPSDRSGLHGLHVTPGAARDLPGAAASSGGVVALLDGRAPDAADNARTALAPLAWKLQSHHVGVADLSEEAGQYRQVRGGLFAGALLTPPLAAGSLPVVALEQIEERRRPLAVLAAVATGAGLGALLLGVIERPVELDRVGTAEHSGLALVLGPLVTALTLPSTLPSLRKATGALGVRAG
ncbi:hypothetical protein [Actinosynnema pretiosum]|uniref:hypothetical protein n=1 Tax=Actinosynnema pretiosum TaxID=42197 RepID=UPI0012FD597C|nr:hypothetical protein [Actinosynnema pretiosum]